MLIPVLIPADPRFCFTFKDPGLAGTDGFFPVRMERLRNRIPRESVAARSLEASKAGLEQPERVEGVGEEIKLSITMENPWKKNSLSSKTTRVMSETFLTRSG